MSQNYLDKFHSALPATQGNQILKRLVSKRDSGEIRTAEEFKNQLQKLTKKILEERITPTLEIFRAVIGQDISSEEYNEMLNRTYNDLEAAFDEADNIDDIIDIHHNLINNVALKMLRYGINELEARIDLYEFLNKTKWGFNDSLFNTFSESLSLNTTRGDKSADLVYIDPVLEERLSSAYDAQVDLIGERLILGADLSKYLTSVDAIWLSNTNSIRSELATSFKSSNIKNIIDSTKNTFWIESLLFEKQKPDGVPMEIAIQFGVVRDINFIEIEPAAPYPMTLVGVDYFGPYEDRLSTSMSSIDITAATRINFENISTNCLVLRFCQKNCQEIQFIKKQGQSNFDKVLQGEHCSIDKQAVSEDLNAILTSDFILSDIFGAPSNTGKMLKYFEYVFGFDNIRPGYSSYKDKGIYVSKPKEVKHLGQTGLKVQEIRPKIVDAFITSLVPYVYSESDDSLYHSSIEYWLVVQHFADNDFLISTDIMPILPLDAQRIHHESLLFTQKRSGTRLHAGQLRFYAEKDATNIEVYRNGSLLTYSTDWEFIDSADANLGKLTVETAGAGVGKPMKRGIEILNTIYPLDIYTVSYTPLVSNTTIIPASGLTEAKVVDLVGDQSARLTLNNIIVFNETKGPYTIDHSKLYLLILMRRNSANQHFSPAVEDYMLVTGAIDSSKFQGV